MIKPDSEADFTIAFHLTWNFSVSILLPPFCLIQYYKSKFISSGYCFDFPLGLSQVWFPNMLSLLAKDTDCRENLQDKGLSEVSQNSTLSLWRLNTN